ncbi:hypothetical protein P22_0682 [Propionispora sp. 2/2-37]|uniref:type III polyketide synthase n=1 Tax=Propionispora sp. 2/2-37 TaxID=1677858 RepID=UPI0006BB5AFE|nr:3-oxoacyl-[acyl-carrier-protein] synthase III C-terminal domain-containing protein [Propionispora sp. 2/2-37]CUH94616.1 hypothetical protein P22_0682 [Propionispora sp. 2/2-37]
MGDAAILSIGTAVPEFQVSQSEIKEVVRVLFHNKIRYLEHMLPIFDHACINRRFLAQPLEWYTQPHSFAERNDLYQIMALQLAEQAAGQAMEKAGISPSDIGMVVFVSSTGIATPTLDTKLIQSLGMSRHVRRLPVWGLGCAGGSAGLARAAEAVQTIQDKVVLLVVVELCSLTFQQNDFSKSNLVGSGLFGDGAAAVLLAREGDGPYIMGNYSTLFDHSEGVMGWDIIESGFKVRFSRDIPSIIRNYLPDLVAQACANWQVDKSAIENFVVHPGGVKVLKAYAESLALDDAVFHDAYDVLARYGNMSSATIFFVLEKFLAENAAAGRFGLLLSMGPGFCAEQVLFQW